MTRKRREEISTAILSLASTWKRFQAAKINLKNKNWYFPEKECPKLTVTSSRCFFSSLEGKLSYVMTIIMINQLFLINLKIVPHLSWEVFEDFTCLWYDTLNKPHYKFCNFFRKLRTESNVKSIFYFLKPVSLQVN